MQSQQKRLLLVMNKEEMRRLRSMLKPLEAHIDWASDVDSAHTALESAEHYDAVIVDQKLPERGWRNVMQSAGELGIQVPFLVCTNEVGDGEIFTESKTTLVSDLLIRPYREELVQERVRSALESRPTKPLDGATIPSHQ